MFKVKEGNSLSKDSDMRRPNEPYSHIVFALIATAMLSYSACVYSADNTADSGQSMFSFSGFGTLGEVHSSDDRADFTSTIFKPNGAGYSHNWSGDVDSLIAAQVNATFTRQLSAMVQVISEQNSDNTYEPHVEWANIKYQLTPVLSLRIGRIVLPSFLISDNRNVGYANPWVRPPLEIYNLVPLSTNDGADASYTVHTGRVAQTFVGVYGQNNTNIVGGGSSHTRHTWLIADTIDSGAATFHISYQQTRLSVDSLNDFFDAFRQFGSQGIALADKCDVDHSLVKSLGIGAMYDPGRWFATAEWGTTDFSSVLGKSTRWYASGGYRLAKFTPYLTYGMIKVNSNTSDPGLTVAAFPPSLAGTATGLNAALNYILGSTPVQTTISSGVRWDFMRNADLKFQYDHIRLGAGSPGVLIDLQPGFQRGSTVNLISIAIDFVF
jgi:hypothetical protein